MRTSTSFAILALLAGATNTLAAPLKHPRDTSAMVNTPQSQDQGKPNQMADVHTNHVGDVNAFNKDGGQNEKDHNTHRNSGAPVNMDIQDTGNVNIANGQQGNDKGIQIEDDHPKFMGGGSSQILNTHPDKLDSHSADDVHPVTGSGKGDFADIHQSTGDDKLKDDKIGVYPDGKEKQVSGHDGAVEAHNGNTGAHLLQTPGKDKTMAEGQAGMGDGKPEHKANASINMPQGGPIDYDHNQKGKGGNLTFSGGESQLAGQPNGKGTEWIDAGPYAEAGQEEQKSKDNGTQQMSAQQKNAKPSAAAAEQAPAQSSGPPRQAAAQSSTPASQPAQSTAPARQSVAQSSAPARQAPAQSSAPPRQAAAAAQSSSPPRHAAAQSSTPAQKAAQSNVPPRLYAAAAQSSAPARQSSANQAQQKQAQSSDKSKQSAGQSSTSSFSAASQKNKSGPDNGDTRIKANAGNRKPENDKNNKANKENTTVKANTKNSGDKSGTEDKSQKAEPSKSSGQGRIPNLRPSQNAADDNIRILPGVLRPVRPQNNNQDQLVDNGSLRNEGNAKNNNGSPKNSESKGQNSSDSGKGRPNRITNDGDGRTFGLSSTSGRRDYKQMDLGYASYQIGDLPQHVQPCDTRKHLPEEQVDVCIEADLLAYAPRHTFKCPDEMQHEYYTHQDTGNDTFNTKMSKQVAKFVRLCVNAGAL